MRHTVKLLGNIQAGDQIERHTSRGRLWEAVTEVRCSVTQVHDTFYPYVTVVGARGDMLSADANHRVLVRTGA